MEPNIPQPQMQPGSPESSSFKTIGLIVLGLIIVTGAVYGGMMWQKGQDRGIVVDETSIWQTYRSDELGFEFLYPRNLVLEENLIENLDLTPDDATDNSQNKDFLTVSIRGLLTLSVNHPGLGFGGYETIQKDSIFVNDLEISFEVLREAEDADSDNPSTFYLYSFDKGGNGYLISASPESSSIVESILPTIKFTVPQASQNVSNGKPLFAKDSCLVITSPQVNQIVNPPLTVTGYIDVEGAEVDTCTSWPVFEGSAGSVVVEDYSSVIVSQAYDIRTIGDYYVGMKRWPITVTITRFEPSKTGQIALKFSSNEQRDGYLPQIQYFRPLQLNYTESPILY